MFAGEEYDVQRKQGNAVRLHELSAIIPEREGKCNFTYVLYGSGGFTPPAFVVAGRQTRALVLQRGLPPRAAVARGPSSLRTTVIPTGAERSRRNLSRSRIPR